ncbi:MAG: hypothetical protein L3K23_02735 [Thermoplasmata archaeon]|nr:hypothetical protein [Thermoplasmata archaeon]
MRWVATVGGVLLLLLGAACASGIAPGHPATAVTPSSEASATPAVTTSPHGNILIRSAAPQGDVPPGMVLTVQYRLAIVNDTTSTGVVPVRVPGTLASFQTHTGPLFVFGLGRNVSLSGPGFSDPNLTTTSTLLDNETVFQTGATASFDTQLAALMTPFPYGSIALYAQWKWTLVAQDGSEVNSSWSPAAPELLQPAQYADLLSIVPVQLAPGGGITSCLGGSIVNRTFSLHAETVRPLNDFVQNTNTVPANETNSFCQTIVIPSNVAPQPLIVHIWDYTVVTLLLYIVKVSLVNATKLNASAVLGLPPVLYLDVGALVVTVAILLWVLGVRRPTEELPETPDPRESMPE